MNDLCVEYKDAIRELCLPLCASFGVSVSCEKCKFIWGKDDREWFHSKLVQAQRELEIDINVAICPQEICREKVYLGDCPITLSKRPIAYIGKKEVVESRTLIICYSELSECGADLPQTFTLNCSEDNDEIGTVLIENIPAGVSLDDIKFCYPDFLVFNTKQSLPTPERITPIFCDEELVAVEVIWPKCMLIHPNCNNTKLSQADCFLTEIQVKFFRVNEDLAIELPGKCDCGACSSGTCNAYTIEIGDPYKGEICINTTCTCFNDDYVYINYATAHNCGFKDELLESAITMLALLRRGHKKFCDCQDSTDYIDWLLELDESVTRENATPFEGFGNRFPYGKTRAGVMLARNVNQIKSQLIRQGVIGTDTGGFLGGLSKKKRLFRNGKRKF